MDRVSSCNIYAGQDTTRFFYDWVLFIIYVSSTCFGPHRSIFRSVCLQAVFADLVCGNTRTTRHVSRYEVKAGRVLPVSSLIRHCLCPDLRRTVIVLTWMWFANLSKHITQRYYSTALLYQVLDSHVHTTQYTPRHILDFYLRGVRNFWHSFVLVLILYTATSCGFNIS